MYGKATKDDLLAERPEPGDLVVSAYSMSAGIGIILKKTSDYHCHVWWNGGTLKGTHTELFTSIHVIKPNV